MSRKRYTTPVHPGVLLREEFLKPMGISPWMFARKIGTSPETIDRIIKGNERLTGDMAYRISEVLKTDPDMWTELQARHDEIQGREKPAKESKVQGNNRDKVEHAGRKPASRRDKPGSGSEGPGSDAKGQGSYKPGNGSRNAGNGNGESDSCREETHSSLNWPGDPISEENTRKLT